jgi:hypothetical protein
MANTKAKHHDSQVQKHQIFEPKVMDSMQDKGAQIIDLNSCPNVSRILRKPKQRAHGIVAIPIDLGLIFPLAISALVSGREQRLL